MLQFRMKKIAFGLMIAFSGLLMVAFIMISPWLIPPLFPGLAEIDTQYTPNFSYEKFNSIKKGIAEDDVIKILKEPLEKWEPGYKCWKYSGEKGIVGGNLGDFLGWVLVQVCFGEDGKVVDTPRTIFYD